MEAYTKRDYQEEDAARYVHIGRSGRVLHDGGCGHCSSGDWCGVCVAAQPSFIQRQFKQVEKQAGVKP